MAGSPTIACSSGDTPQTLFNPPGPPLRFAPALALLHCHNKNSEFSEQAEHQQMTADGDNWELGTYPYLVPREWSESRDLYQEHCHMQTVWCLQNSSTDLVHIKCNKFLSSSSKLYVNVAHSAKVKLAVTDKVLCLKPVAWKANILMGLSESISTLMTSGDLILHEWLTWLREHSKVFTGTTLARRLPPLSLEPRGIKCLVQVEMAPQNFSNEPTGALENKFLPLHPTPLNHILI
jgi:hypothetical protein